MKSSLITEPSPPDRPHVVVFPPVLPLGGLLLGFALERIFPLAGRLAWLSLPPGRIAGAALVALGLTFIVSSRTAMMRARTNVSPRLPTLRLVQRWPFIWSRNPMYLGGNLALVGLGLALPLPWVLVFFPFLVGVCHYGVVLREEQYLEQKFGAAYLNYKSRVRRWL